MRLSGLKVGGEEIDLELSDAEGWPVIDIDRLEEVTLFLRHPGGRMVPLTVKCQDNAFKAWLPVNTVSFREADGSLGLRFFMPDASPTQGGGLPVKGSWIDDTPEPNP